MVNQINYDCEHFEEIEEYCSLSEFKRFQNFIKEAIDNELLIEIPVEKRYGGFAEQWFKCTQCQGKWRLVHPDFPFKGLWAKVTDEQMI